MSCHLLRCLFVLLPLCALPDVAFAEKAPVPTQVLTHAATPSVDTGETDEDAAQEEGGAGSADTVYPTGIDARRRILPLKMTITKYYWNDIKELPGSGYYLSEEQIKASGTTDVNRLMWQVPGVNVQEEDGFGLRPNIGMRGGRIDRSADITLMEDGVLIAPAPYTAPQAYYFPRMERMTGIEVRKGSSTIKYGPRTTNGAINLLTRSVPDVAAGAASVSAGSYGGVRAGLHGGNSVVNDMGSFGILGEFHHASSDGFKKQDVTGGDTGFNISDYMAKLRFKTGVGATYYQEIEAKFGYTDEDSNETYLGLTTADFNANPFRRYAAAQMDQMDTHHRQAQISYYIEPTSTSSLTATIYRNDFNRNWYRLQSVRSGSNLNISAVLNDPAAHAAHLAVLQGGNSAANGLTVRANKRDYYAQGIQTAFAYRTSVHDVRNEIEIGLRYHYDEQDRYQHDDIYQMTGGIMTLTSAGAPGSQDNRIGSATAWAAYLLDRMDFGRLALTPGVRFEYIDLNTENFGTADPARTGANLQRFGSRIRAAVPGIGMEYNLADAWQLVGGVHKGFAPPEPPNNASAAQNARKEESVNYEGGLRYRHQALRVEAIGFFNDYTNLLGADTFSGGGSGGDQFNGGKVHVWGLESAVAYDFSDMLALPHWRIPARLSYTRTHAEFRSSFNSTFGEWGNVTKGDQLPYIAPHQFFLSLGVGQQTWQLSANGRYQGRMRTVAGSGPLLEDFSTDGNMVIDLYAEMEAASGIYPFASVTNLLDETYIAARRPAGARPGVPQMVYAGIRASF